MREEKFGKLLNELAEASTEGVSPGLAEDIKRQIPPKLAPHTSRLDTINIMIDLRISKLAAAAAIIITMVLWTHFLGSRDLAGGGIYQDSKLLIKYFLWGDDAGRGDISVDMSSLYEDLVRQGKDVVYYGDSIDSKDSSAVLIQWKLDNGRYSIILGDLSVKTVNAEELIKLQAQMLQKKAKR